MLPRTFLFMIACAVVGWFLGRTRGMGLQGFFMGLAFGPLGWGLILLWPTRWIEGPVPRDAPSGAPGASGPDPVQASGSSGRPSGADRASGPHAREGSPACPRCRRPVAPDAGACPHCGNVLVPVHYRVNPG